MRSRLPTVTTPILYSVPEAAARLNVAPKWVYERTRKNAIPYRRLGKYVRFSDADLAAIIDGAYIAPVGGSISIGGICDNVSNGDDYGQDGTQKGSDASGSGQSRPAQEI
jgi:excisionase family DNA binding protein